MNNQLLIDFLNKIRNNIDVLSMAFSKTEIDTKESTVKIKETKNDLTHLHNLLKAEESLQEMRQSNRWSKKSKCYEYSDNSKYNISVFSINVFSIHW